MPKQLYPGLVFVFEPAYSHYRVFFTGGLADPERWIFGTWDGLRTIEQLPEGSKRLAKGVYSAPSPEETL